MKIGDHIAIVLLALHMLFLKNVRSRPGITGEEQEQVVLKAVQGVGIDLKRPGLDLMVGKEPETGDPAKGGNVLILFTHRLFEEIDFDVARLLGQFLRMDKILFQRVQGLQQRGRKARRGSQACAGRDVGHASDF